MERVTTPIDPPCISLLIVEGDEVSRESLAFLLRNQGYQVHTAANGAAALELLTAWSPDVVLLELHLPVLSGWELLALRRRDARLAAIPVITLTTAEDDPLALGAQAGLRKRYEFAELLKTIAQVRSASAAAAIPA